MIPTAIIHALNCRAAITASQFGMTEFQAYMPRKWWTKTMLAQYPLDAESLVLFVDEEDFTRDGREITAEELAIQLPAATPSLDEFGEGHKIDPDKLYGADIEIKVYGDE